MAVEGMFSCSRSENRRATTGSPRRLANDQPAWHTNSSCSPGISLFDPIKQKLCCSGALLGDRLLNGRQRWRCEGGQGNIIEAGDGNILRHTQSKFVGGSERSDRCEIISGEDRCWRPLQICQACHSLKAILLCR